MVDSFVDVEKSLPSAPGLDFQGVRLWPVGSLLSAIADSLEARFNPVAVRGEISGFSRASSGHCYFSLKDDQGQVRCAMFRRAASLVDFSPRDGHLVELRGRLGVYEPRGELQLVVESMRQAGQGTLFDQFLKLKARLESEGLFDAGRKRPLPLIPGTIGVVTSLGAAVLHDVVTALQRRAPHVRVVIYPASVQGAQAAGELCQALLTAYQRREADVLLLVRGGGAMEDLWAFNDEALARTIAASPTPVVSGVGHETDFTIADFCADLRAPTATAAAELSARPQGVWRDELQMTGSRLQKGLDRQLQMCSQRLDLVTLRISQPSHFVTRQSSRLSAYGQHLEHAMQSCLNHEKVKFKAMQTVFSDAINVLVKNKTSRLDKAQLRLELLNPQLVLQRGYAWIADEKGHAITNVSMTRPGQPVRATFVDGQVDLTVS